MNEGNVYRTLGFMSLNDSMSRLIVLAGAYDNSGEGSSSYRETDVHFEDGIAKITMQTVMLDVIPLDSLGAKIKAIIKIPIEGPKYDVAEIIYGRIPIPEVRVEGTV